MGLAAAAAVLCLLVRRWQPDMAGVTAAVAGCILLLGALENLQGLQELLQRLTELGGLHEGYLTMLLKVLGMSYATELAAQTCEDLGENGLALKAGMAGRLCMFAVIAPLLLDLLDMIIALIP